MRKGMGLAVVAGVLALSLVAADSTDDLDQVDVGSAETALSAVDLTVTDPDGLLDALGGAGDLSAGAIDAATFATNGADAAALAELVPLTLGGEEHFGISASSDGDGSDSSDGGQAGGNDVDPASAEARASALEALAEIDSAVTEIASLGGALGLDVSAAGIRSTVDQTEAAATQGLAVSGLDLALGDLVPLDVLEQLPLADILALLDELPVDAPGNVTDAADDLDGALADLDGALADFADDGEAVEAAADAVTLGGVDGLDDILDALAGYDDDVGDVEGELDDLSLTDLDLIATLESLLGDLEGTSDDILAEDLDGVGLAASNDCDPDTDLDLTGADPIGDVEEVAADLHACIDDLEDQADDLTDGVTGLGDLETATADLLDGIADIDGAIADLLAAVSGLEDLLDDILALLPDIAGSDLLGVSATDIGVNAVATDTVDASSATVLCEPITVTILGEGISSPDCSEGLKQVRGITDQVTGALGGVTDVLGALPTSEVVSAGDLTLEMFPELTERVTERDGTVTSRAAITVLDLQLPSVTIDPAAFGDGILPDLDIDGVLADVEGVLADAEAALGEVAGELDAAGLTDDLAVVDGLIADVEEAAADLGLEADLDELTDLIDGLDLGELGTLDASVTTPGIGLTIDPVSTASFTPASAAPAGPDDPVPAPGEPSGAPTLPKTGGGAAALLGLLALAGAWMLRTRRA